MLESSQKISISNSWGKLQSLLITRPDENNDENKPTKFSKTSRPPNPRMRLLTPNRIVLKDSKDGTNQIVKSSRPTTAPTRSLSIGTIPKAAIEGLTVIQLQKIYKAKCADLGITVIPDQESRFFNSCLTHFKDRKFDMIESGLGQESAKVIGEILRNNMNFSCIQLGKNTIGDEGVIQLIKLLRKNFSLVHLDISSNDITPSGAAEIFKIIKTHPSLASIDVSSHEGLHRNRLGIEGAQALGIVLKSNRILEFLNLSGISIGLEGVQYIAEGLNENKSLVSLNLANNNLDWQCMELLTKTLVTTNVRELNVSSNRIGSDGAEYLSLMIIGAYEGSCPLIKLDASSCEIGTKGAAKIFESLRMNIQMRYLILNDNPLTQGLSSAFLALLIDNVVLKELHIGKCGIKPEQISDITEGLTKNKTLETLDLSNNLIRDEGAELIALGLAKNTKLTTLDLSGNKIKNAGGISLGQALKENTTLESLVLKDNSIKDEAGQILYEVSRLNQNILRLVLDLNPVNLKYINDIRQNMKRNKENHSKKIIPKLREKIEKLTIDHQEVEEIQWKLHLMRREHEEAEMKLDSDNDKLDIMKENEEVKVEVLHSEYLSLKRLNEELSENLNNINQECQLLKSQSEWTMNDLADKIAHAVAETKRAEKKRSSVREETALKRGQSNEVVSQLNDKLFLEEAGKRNAGNTLKILKERLDAKKEEIASLRSPKESKRKESKRDLKHSPSPKRKKGVIMNKLEETKTFLASEKLASRMKEERKKRSRSNNTSQRITRNVSPIKEV
ncbi:unnamed protein product [Blepharisma stoltei]|uniref:Uncharacterized protein n=1 Tax=Blepharisma stoltei TaxID=1481888 RepID=A0AAU9IUZ5_9CILI|nr:unnamed protein product [Blepharisma stoltei]